MSSPIQAVPNYRHLLDQQNPRCDYCGELIYGIYMVREIEGKSYNMCKKCWLFIREIIKEIMGSLEADCLHDLNKAHKLDQHSETIEKNLDGLKKTIKMIKQNIINDDKIFNI